MKQSLTKLLFVAGFLLLSVRAFAVFNLGIDSVTNPSSVILGDSITYTIAFSNAGPDARSATSLRIEGLRNFTLDSLSVTIAGVPQTCPIVGRRITCPWVSMSSGAVGSATLALTPAQVGTFNLRVMLYPLAEDTNPDNNRSTRTTAVTLATEDLQLTASAGSGAPRNLGQIIYHTLVVLNAGPSSATNTRVTCNFNGPFNLTYGSAGCAVDPTAENTVSCNLGELASTGRVVFRADLIPTEVGIFSGTCTLTSDLVDSNPANSSGVFFPAVTINPALPVADLAVTLGANASSVAAGSPLTYTVTINNNGPADAPQVSATSSFSSQTIVSTISGRWSPNPSTEPFVEIATTDCLVLPFFDGDDSDFPVALRPLTTRCSLPSLPIGGQIVVSINASRAFVGTLSHTASASATGSTDPVTTNNSVILNIPVNDPLLCGDGTCDTDSGETCTSCSNDCGTCPTPDPGPTPPGPTPPGPDPTPEPVPEPSPSPVPAVCGNNSCEPGEDNMNCAVDCPAQPDEILPPPSSGGCSLIR